MEKCSYPSDPESTVFRRKEYEPDLHGFATHSLLEVGALALMSRIDTKYLISTACLPELLNAMQAAYSVLAIDDRRLLAYRTDYFDTADFQFYNAHHSGRANRTKVRCRHYLDSDTRFLEIKAKNNKGRTSKTRIDIAGSGQMHELVPNLLERLCPAMSNVEPLVNKLHVFYERLTLQSVSHAERVTIDLNLGAGRDDMASVFSLHGLAIVELKQPQFSSDSPVHRLLRHLRVRPGSFSKYCISSALLYPERLKTNRFKKTLARIHPYMQLTRGT